MGTVTLHRENIQNIRDSNRMVIRDLRKKKKCFFQPSLIRRIRGGQKNRSIFHIQVFLQLHLSLSVLFARPNKHWQCYNVV